MTVGIEEDRDARSEAVVNAELEAALEAEQEAEEAAQETAAPTAEPYKPTGNTIDSGEWNGLSWLVTDAGELAVTGHMTDPYPEEGWITGKNGVWWGWSQAAPWKEYRARISSAYLAFSGAESLIGFFDGYKFLSEVNLSALDTGNVTKMGSMFSGCRGLQTIWVGKGWQMPDSDVTAGMFSYCGVSSVTKK